MGFEIKTVKNCPVTRGSVGRILIPTDLWGELAGATHKEKIEWMALGLGERSEDGLEVKVWDLEVPKDQQRTSGSVAIPQTQHGLDVVLAIHSHHSMGAFWSGTDEQDINRKFPSSLVLSSKCDSDVEWALGVSYKAVGRTRLSCGAIGVVEMIVVPTDENHNVVEWWPQEWQGWGWGRLGEHLGDCANVEMELDGELDMNLVAKCGLKDRDKVFGVFGLGGEELVKRLPPEHKVYAQVATVDSRSRKQTYKWDKHQDAVVPQLADEEYLLAQGLTLEEIYGDPHEVNDAPGWGDFARANGHKSWQDAEFWDKYYDK